MAKELRRIITKFRRGCDNRESATDVTAVPFEVICRIVPPGPMDPLLYDCYKLSRIQLSALLPDLTDEFATARYDYYLEAESDEELDVAASKLIQEKNTRDAIQVTVVGIIRARS